jgi:hypothetical protein
MISGGEAAVVLGIAVPVVALSVTGQGPKS